MSADAGHQTDRVEVAAAVLLAVATVATAWSGYQASRWNGEQAKAFSRFAQRASSPPRVRSRERADSDRRGDVHAVGRRVRAQEQTELADFYFARFRPEFQPALDAWIATRPLKNPDAPLTPFAMPEYKLAAREAESEQLELEADAAAAEARTDVQRATNYVLCVVLFAAVLFFAGMSAKLRTRRIQIALLTFGLVLFLGAVAWIATFPVSVTV